MSTTHIGSGPTILSANDVEAYRRDGFLICRRVFTASEMKELEKEAIELQERADLKDTNNIRCRWKNRIDTNECTFETFDPVIDIAPICKKFAQDNRILDRLADIYGEPAHLFKDKLIFKPPAVEGYNLHQDWISWPGFPQSFVTVLVPIDASTRSNGCTMVYPGCHQSGYVSPHDGEYHDTPLSWVAGIEPVPLELEPGDIAVFGAFTPHYSDPNRSPTPRRQLYLSYNADSDGGERREKHYQEFHDWLRVKYAQYGRTEVFFR